MEHKSKVELIIGRVKVEAEQNNAAADGSVIQEAKIEAERIRASAERDAASIIDEASANAKKRLEAAIAKASTNVMKQMGVTVAKADDTVNNREQEILSGEFGDMRRQMLPEAMDKTDAHTDLTTSEAEQTASRIINEAKERALIRTADESKNYSDSRNVSNQAIKLEPNAPNLLAELRKRYAEITFGEFQLSQYSLRQVENVDSSTIEFAVLSGGKKGQIGRYLVHTNSLKIIGKMYEHWGKFLVIRGRVSDWDYQYLQQLAEKGQLHEANRSIVQDGMRNFVIYNLPVFLWSSALGREDRYINDVQFP